MPKSKKIKLHGFSNLTKTLSLNIYDINHAATPVQDREYIRYIDHKIKSIQNFLARDTRERCQMADVNVYQENIFDTKTMLKRFDLDSYFFGVDVDVDDISPKAQRMIS